MSVEAVTDPLPRAKDVISASDVERHFLAQLQCDEASTLLTADCKIDELAAGEKGWCGQIKLQSGSKLVLKAAGSVASHLPGCTHLTVFAEPFHESWYALIQAGACPEPGRSG